MASVFKKLISKELGENRYNKYFFCYQRRLEDKSYDYKTLENEEIFNDIYDTLKDKDIAMLKKMLERLTDAMFLALRISRTFIFAVVFFIFASLFLISRDLAWYFIVGGLLIMGVSFLYKTYEFIVNKYCYIDAHIIIVYKSVLDNLILKNESSVKQ